MKSFLRSFFAIMFFASTSAASTLDWHAAIDVVGADTLQLDAEISAKELKSRSGPADAQQVDMSVHVKHFLLTLAKDAALANIFEHANPEYAAPVDFASADSWDSVLINETKLSAAKYSLFSQTWPIGLPLVFVSMSLMYFGSRRRGNNF